MLGFTWINLIGAWGWDRRVRWRSASAPSLSRWAQKTGR